MCLAIMILDLIDTHELLSELKDIFQWLQVQKFLGRGATTVSTAPTKSFIRSYPCQAFSDFLHFRDPYKETLSDSE